MSESAYEDTLLTSTVQVIHAYSLSASHLVNRVATSTPLTDFQLTIEKFMMRRWTVSTGFIESHNSIN